MEMRVADGVEVDVAVADEVGEAFAELDIDADGDEVGDADTDRVTDGDGVGVANDCTVRVFPSKLQDLPAATVEVGRGVAEGFVLFVAVGDAEGLSDAAAGTASSSPPQPATVSTTAVKPATARIRARPLSNIRPLGVGWQELRRRKNIGPPRTSEREWMQRHQHNNRKHGRRVYAKRSAQFSACSMLRPEAKFQRSHPQTNYDMFGPDQKLRKWGR